MPRSRVWHLAIIFTLLNALKAIHIDDTAYYFYAAQIARHPFDPYGFQIHWGTHFEPAMNVLAPPLLPYWWALGIRLLGESVFLWKLWLFPFAFALVWALNFLFRRYAPGNEKSFLWLTVFSPVLLPSFNFMLDIPALGLSLLALCLFIEACEKKSPGLSLVSGIVVSLAMQTKYTSFLVPLVLLLHAGIERSDRKRSFARWLLICAVAGAGFLTWELSNYFKYGVSHGGYHVLERASSSGTLQHFVGMFRSLGPTLACTAPVQALLALIALGAAKKWVYLSSVVLLVGWLFVLFGVGEIRVFDLFGLAYSFALIAFFIRVSRSADRAEKFLLAWLAVELAGFFFLSPFPAVRRIIGVFTVVMLLLARALSRKQEAFRATYRWTAGLSVGLALAFWFSDVLDAASQKKMVDVAVTEILRGSGTTWYTGHWGFQYYAEKAGMRPVTGSETVMQKGDWVVLPGDRTIAQRFVIDPKNLELVLDWREFDRWPFRTQACYYMWGGVSMSTLQGRPRTAVRVYRVKETFRTVAVD